jgi:hypothetical protein
MNYKYDHLIKLLITKWGWTQVPLLKPKDK